MDNDKFRSAFPEFSDAVVYTEDQLTFWASFAALQIDQNKWASMYDNGVYLYVAHEITIQSQNVKAALLGKTPGQQSGIANAKAVGSVNASYDSTSQTEKDAGYWNRTTYGMKFYRLMKLFGMGAIQL